MADRASAVAVTGLSAVGGFGRGSRALCDAHGTGTKQSDAAEAIGLRGALGACAGRVPLGSTKSVHGHTLADPALLEPVITVPALQRGRLPVDAGCQDQAPDCAPSLVLEPSITDAEYGLGVNAAFGGANTALVVQAGSRD